ncbi:hypothetical protein [Halorubrum halodurans]|uniref:hypothetical protein n=1 Tax=Halorubrum halodurans TaxID=1383851 RepID=UPI001FEC8B5D|nr:hypothetical protein [Halorubrum halodurans]
MDGDIDRVLTIVACHDRIVVTGVALRGVPFEVERGRFRTVQLDDLAIHDLVADREVDLLLAAIDIDGVLHGRVDDDSVVFSNVKCGIRFVDTDIVEFLVDDLNSY